MKDALKTIGITGIGILFGYLLVRLAEYAEKHYDAKKVADVVPPARPEAEHIGDTTDH